jgi:hypothetical protein
MARINSFSCQNYSEGGLRATFRSNGAPAICAPYRWQAQLKEDVDVRNFLLRQLG